MFKPALALAFGLALVPGTMAQISVEPVAGSVVLCGLPRVPAGLWTELETLVSKREASERQVVLLSSGWSEEERAAELGRWADGARLGTPEILDADAPGAEAAAAAAARLDAALATADLVWLVGPGSFGWVEGAAADGSAASSWTAFRERGGVVGAQGAAIRWLGAQVVDGDGGARPGLGWLPDCVVFPADIEVAAIEAALDRCVGRVGVRAGVLVAAGRRVRSVGGDGGTLHLPAARNREHRTITVPAGGGVADLTRWRRAARWRPLQEDERRAPAALPQPGTVLAAGGLAPPAAPGDEPQLPPAVWRAFVDAVARPPAEVGASGALDGEDASRKAPRIVVVTTASRDPLGEGRWVRARFEAFAARVDVVDLGDRARSMELLRRAGGVWFCGDRPWLLIDALEDPEPRRRVRQVLERGGVVGGSGAVVAAFGRSALRCAPLDDRILIAEGYERGLGFLPGYLIEPHCEARGHSDGLSDLAARLAPQVALGIDEGMAVVARGATLQVLGTLGAVRLARVGEAVPFALTGGEVFDVVRWAPR